VPIRVGQENLVLIKLFNRLSFQLLQAWQNSGETIGRWSAQSQALLLLSKTCPAKKQADNDLEV
jgi:hypothetical protein